MVMLLKEEIDIAPSPAVENHPMSEAANGAPQEMTDAQLVTLTKKKIQWASERLVTRYYPKALSLAYQMCNGDREEAAEVTQQAFLNALAKISSFKENASFKTWFYRILVNTGLDARRKQIGRAHV